MRQYERKQDIIDSCLATFMKKGLAHTTTKNLCDSLNLNSGGVFYYFKTKDEIIVACAEEANKRIERDLFGIAIDDIEHPVKLSRELKKRADEMRPLMKFYVSVCSSPEYGDKMKPAYDRLNEKYAYYIDKIADKLLVSAEDVAPYVYIVVNTVLSYMIFGEDNFAAPQQLLIYNKITELIERKKKLSASEPEAAAADIS